MRRIKQILRVAKWSFIDWLMDVRQIFVLLLLICVSNYTVAPLVKMAKGEGKPLNMVEPFLANVNSVFFILIILFCWIVLISDYPKMEGNNGYILIRINRLTWLAGKVLAFFLAAVTFLAEVTAVFTVRACSVCFIADGWSTLMQEAYMEMDSGKLEQYGVRCIVQDRVFNHYTPYEAFTYTALLLLGFCCMTALVMTAASLGKSKTAGLVVNVVLIVGGYSLVHTVSVRQFWLPVANVMLDRQATSLIRLVSKEYGYRYFAVCCAALLALSIVLVRHGQVQKDGER